MTTNNNKDKQVRSVTKGQSEFFSSMRMNPEDIQEVLNERIELENKLALENATEKNFAVESNMLNNLHFLEKKVNIVSLFSGAGGLDLGVELAGLSVVLGEREAYRIFEDKDLFEYSLLTKGIVNTIYSNDVFDAANQTYVRNFPSSVIQDNRDIRKIITFPQSNLMLGGFPCPGFSAAGPRLLDDPRNFLYIHYIRALIQSQPAFFVAENVRGLMTMGRGRVLEQIKEDFSAAHYTVKAHLVNARDYGVPQSRERVFIIGVRNDIAQHFNYTFPNATHGSLERPWVTLHDAIADLPYEANDVYQGDYSSMYMSRNRKKSWNDQSFTIQASGRQAPQHPAGEPMEHVGKDLWEFRGNQNRRLSVRECARIQTFPDWFSFSNGENSKTTNNHRLNQQYKQIGNAVPVYLAEKIVRPIIQFLYENPQFL